MLFTICIILFFVLYVWVGWYLPIQQIKKSSFSEKRKWVDRLRN